MNLFELIILAIALGVDCLIVSFSQGLLIQKERIKTSLLLASVMGAFQGLMPLIAYFFTAAIYSYIAPIGKWIVFLIFTVLSIRCILGAISKSEDDDFEMLGWKQILFLGVATSIDALGAGVSLKLTDSNMLIAGLIIALASFVMSLIGFWSGCCLKKTHTKVFEFIAGGILIFLAIKSLT